MKIFLLLLTFGLAQTPFCQQTIPQQLDALMQAYTKLNKFNGSVLVAQKGRVLLTKGYGTKNAHALNDVNSIFQTYSITKSFTSTVVLRLVEEHRLSLSDQLSQFYPQFPKGDSITIEHLLTHTAGVYDYTRGNDMPDQTEQSFIHFLSAKPLDFSPGSQFRYSNSGYWLLGFIIEKVTGKKYETVVQQYIFDPLHMQHSGFHYKNLLNKNKTTGYAVFTTHRKKEATVYDPPGPYAAGAIYSTVGDLYKFHQALKTAKLISKASQEQAYTPFKNKYGYGWIIDSADGHRMVSHSGGAAGFRSNLARLPQEDICIILLNNHENASVDRITKNLLKVLFHQPYKAPVNRPLPDSILEHYTGAFYVNPSITFYTTLEDGYLVIQPSKQSKTQLLAEKTNSFYAEEPDAYIQFTRGAQERYDTMNIIKEGKNIFTGHRIPATWGLTGTATTKEWNDSIPDLLLQQDPLQKGIWSIQSLSLKTGLLLFRQNNDWGYHYGDNGQDRSLEMYGADIKIEAGAYDITLDLTDILEPRYRIVKKP